MEYIMVLSIPAITFTHKITDIQIAGRASIIKTGSKTFQVTKQNLGEILTTVR